MYAAHQHCKKTSHSLFLEIFIVLKRYKIYLFKYLQCLLFTVLITYQHKKNSFFKKVCITLEMLSLDFFIFAVFPSGLITIVTAVLMVQP